MIPVNQTKIFPPEHTHVGNSFQACLASILETSITEIPPFGEAAALDWGEWTEWLKSKGLISWIMPFNPTYFKVNADKVVGHFIGYKILIRDEVEKRSAIIIDEGQIVHDPYATDESVKKLIDSGVFVGRLL